MKDKKRKCGDFTRVPTLGGSASFCCLNLFNGFILISALSIFMGVLFIGISFPMWQFFGTTSMVISMLDKFVDSAGWMNSFGDRVEPADITDAMILLTQQVRKWAWWTVWLAGVIWLLTGFIGFWVSCGCCLGKRMYFVRRRALIFVVMCLLIVQWAFTISLWIAFPIWLKAAWDISIVPTLLGKLFYLAFVLYPVIFGGFYLVDSAFSFYRVASVGGDGGEYLNYQQIRDQKDIVLHKNDEDYSESESAISEAQPLMKANIVDETGTIIGVYDGPPPPPDSLSVKVGEDTKRPSVTAVGHAKEC